MITTQKPTGLNGQTLPSAEAALLQSTFPRAVSTVRGTSGVVPGGRYVNPPYLPMTRWTPKFDMTSIPDEQLWAEVARRRSAARGDNVGGRPSVQRPCPHCKKPFGARALRAHVPICPKR